MFFPILTICYCDGFFCGFWLLVFFNPVLSAAEAGERTIQDSNLAILFQGIRTILIVYL